MCPHIFFKMEENKMKEFCEATMNPKNVCSVLQDMNNNGKILAVDIGQTQLLTFSNPVVINNKFKGFYNFYNDKYVGLVTWCKENPQIRGSKEYDEYFEKINHIRKGRMFFLKAFLDQLFDENDIEVFIMEHDLEVSRQLLDEGWKEYNYLCKKRKCNKNSEEMHTAWKKITKGYTCMIDETQNLLKTMCKERGIILVQTPKGWVSTYRCSKTGIEFDRAEWLDKHNTSEKLKWKDEYTINKSLHKINNKVRLVISKPHPDYELATLICNQEIKRHNANFPNYQLNRVTQNDVKNASFDDKGYLSLLKDIPIYANFIGFNSLCRLRDFECPVCGYRHNRDKNAAINIKNKGIEILNNKYAKVLNQCC